MLVDWNTVVGALLLLLLVGEPSAALFKAVDALPAVDLSLLQASCESEEHAEALAERVFFLYAFLSYAYLRAKDREETDEAVRSKTPLALPCQLAKPWYDAATYVDRAPQLDYTATVLLNIEPFDDAGAMPPVCYTSTPDERFFYRLHARIELAAAPAVGGMLRALTHVEDAIGGVPGPYPVCCEEEQWSAAVLREALDAVAMGLRDMAALMPRMSAGCAPTVFHERIRTPLSSFARPVAFLGVMGTPLLELGGASGAQSAILPAVDAFLGIAHTGPHELVQWSPSSTPFLRHLPPAHRDFIRRLREAAPGRVSNVKAVVARLSALSHPDSSRNADALLAAHAGCVESLKAFRKAHMALVREFIIAPALDDRVDAVSAKLGGATGSPSSQKPSPSLERTLSNKGGTAHGAASPVDVRYTFVGTGGSDLMSFLSGRLLDTARAGISSVKCSGPCF